MFDRYMILTRLFKNTVENGSVIGFQVGVRITYYRGIPLSCVEGFDVTVDGETFAPESIRYGIGNRVYSFAEAANTIDVRWQFGDPLTLIIPKPGGLAKGIHKLTVVQKLRSSYHTEEANPSVAIDKKRITIAG